MGAPMITESPARGAGSQPPTTCPSLFCGTYGQLRNAARRHRVLTGSPLATSHGMDIHDQVFGDEIAGRPPTRAHSERG